jgi:choline dehydrogenase-like flavoprotein
MDNLTMVSGRLHPARPAEFVNFYDIFGWEDRIEPTGLNITNSFQPSRAAQERARMGNYVAFLHNGHVGEWSSGYRALRYLYGRIRQGYLPDRLGEKAAAIIAQPAEVSAGLYSWFLGKERFREFVLYHHWEQSPNRDSRITLHETERDALGLPKLKMDWRFTPLERHTAARGQEMVAAALERAGIGRVELEFAEDSAWPENFTSSAHFMGSTRMHEDPRKGVVDADCRVHGVENLYIAGGSVFPTNGATMPTYNIVALALRLGEHLQRRAEEVPITAASIAANDLVAARAEAVA